MIKIQVVFGRFTALDVQCKRCRGRGQEEHPLNSTCLFCGGSGVVQEQLGRAYTYLAPDGTKLWDVMQAEATSSLTGARETKVVTVVSLTSSYDGPCKEAYPLPPTTMDCPGCGMPGMPIRSACCRACWARVPQELAEAWEAALAAPGIFKRVGAILRVREWLKENPPELPMVDGGRPAGYGLEEAPEWTS